MRISTRQTGPERLTAHQPAINTELAPNLFEGVDTTRHPIRCRIFRRRRTTVPPKLDDDRSNVLLQSRKIWPPLDAARQKAMNQKDVRAPASRLHFDMKLHGSNHQRADILQGVQYRNIAPELFCRFDTDNRNGKAAKLGRETLTLAV